MTTIIHVPMDERPVNVELPAMVAAIAGVVVVQPPRELLSSYKVPGRADELIDWLAGELPAADGMAISLDMLVHGGLIPSRTSADSTLTTLTRLNSVAELAVGTRCNAGITVTRASKSNTNAEEPDYWATHGYAMHHMGGDLHRAFLGEPQLSTDDWQAVPAEHRQDFLRRRLRNHQVVLQAIGEAQTERFNWLAVTADDTAERAAGSVEQLWYQYWIDALEAQDQVRQFPGADEVGCLLIMRTVCELTGVHPRVLIRVPEPGGAERVANYENRPVGATLARQVEAAGGIVVDDPALADAVIVAHAPDPGHRDATAPDIADAADPAAIAAVVEALSTATGLVGLADVRYSNGSDPVLTDALIDAGLIGSLTAYGAWNTAGNTIGSVVGALVASVVGRELGSFDEQAQRRLLGVRLLEDDGYQARVRGQLLVETPAWQGHVAKPFTTADEQQHAIDLITQRLGERWVDYGVPGRLTEVSLPWDRLFEVDLTID